MRAGCAIVADGITNGEQAGRFAAIFRDVDNDAVPEIGHSPGSVFVSSSSGVKGGCRCRPRG